MAKKAREKAEKIGVTASGESTADPAVMDAHIAEETETIQEIEEKGWTGFHTDETGPFVYEPFKLCRTRTEQRTPP